jgi:chromate transporter
VSEPAKQIVPLTTIVRQWSRIGLIGFGGPPAHVTLFRNLCVDDRGWMSDDEFEDGVAATNLLPGPASTQLAIYCAWRLRGTAGAVLGGFCFIVPGLVAILALAALFLSSNPPTWVLGAASGSGAAVPAVAVAAAATLIPASWRRAGAKSAQRIRWFGYLAAGIVSAATIGAFLVLVLLACGLVEIAARSGGSPRGRRALFPLVVVPTASGGLVALSWVALKVGALSYGGGFVIIPLMQHDAVVAHHWLTGGQFLNAVALGQVTPGPVVHTVAVVGYAASGVWGGVLAAVIAFAPSFIFVLAGARYFDRLRADARMEAFFVGAGAAAIGAIAGSAIPLAAQLAHVWQVGVLCLSAGWLLALHRSVVLALVGAAVLGIVAVLCGAPA